MKVHYKETSTVAPGYAYEAIRAWRQDGLILFSERLCDGLMMKTAHEAYLTSNKKYVTCKRCLNKIKAREAK